MYYSVGRAGQYLLHVRLRREKKAVPGSPFPLTVLPGPAHAKSTRLPSGLLRGMVGEDAGDECGCHLTFTSADKMGNLCVTGGAVVTISAWRGTASYAAKTTTVEIAHKVNDNGDGTYSLEWKSK